MATLFQLTERASQIEEALYETGGELTPEIEALMTETAAELPAKVDNYNALIQKLTAMSENCDREIKRLQALKRTADNGAKSIKGHLLAAMQTFGFDRLEGNFCKVSRRKSRALSVDEATLLAGFPEIAELQATLPDYITLEAKVSKTVIKNHEKESGILPVGCKYDDNESIQIR